MVVPSAMASGIILLVGVELRTEVQFKMVIPLRNGYRARIECDCPSRRSFEAFAKSIQKIGLAREVTQDDMANAEKASWRRGGGGKL